MNAIRPSKNVSEKPRGSACQMTSTTHHAKRKHDNAGQDCNNIDIVVDEHSYRKFTRLFGSFVRTNKGFLYNILLYDNISSRLDPLVTFTKKYIVT